MHPFKTVNQQISILKSRGMIFKNIPKAKIILSRKNYYNIINGMKNLFLDSSVSSSEQYLPGISFEEVFSAYEFDKKLRSLFLKNILIIEDELRRHVAYEFARIEGPCSWNMPSSFDCSSPRQTRYVNDLITKLNENVSRVNRDSHDDMLAHFSSRGETIPIWALVNTFEFGTLKTFLRNCKQNIKDAVSDHYGLSYSVIKSFTETLNMFRNVCAHDFRVVFYRIYDLDKRISDTLIHSEMKIERDSSGQYKYGKNDLFSVVIIFKYMLSDKDFKTFFVELKRLFASLKRKLKVISIDDIYNSIGFPTKRGEQKKWKSILKVNK